MAECLAARLTVQEEQIGLLTEEIATLRDGLSRGADAAICTVVSPELESLRTENEKLKYRLLHLQRGLQAELKLEEEAQEKRKGAKCDKAPEKPTSKVQQTNNPTDKKVATVDTKSGDKNQKKEKKQEKAQGGGGVKEVMTTEAS